MSLRKTQFLISTKGTVKKDQKKWLCRGKPFNLAVWKWKRKKV